jgi:hypothetical protein
MRLPDEFLRSVVFLGQREVEHGKEKLHLGGTAFVVGVPTREPPVDYHLYLVTARHSIFELEGMDYLVRANTKEGCFKEIPISGNEKWWFHPTEETSVDVAVLPWQIADDDDTRFLKTDELFLIRETESWKDSDVGPGDEVYTVGLFTKLRGETKNFPIVRTGNIAMTPDEMLPEATIGKFRGPIEAFLIESRSVGGLSGSPVFVRVTATKNTILTADSGRKRWGDISVSGPLYLIGLAHGHWEIAPERKNKVKIHAALKDEPSINLGIAVVIPAKKIMEVLNHPELIQMREKDEKRTLEKEGTTTQDSAFKRPKISKKTFVDTLKKVSRKVKPKSSESDQGNA